MLLCCATASERASHVGLNSSLQQLTVWGTLERLRSKLLFSHCHINSRLTLRAAIKPNRQMWHNSSSVSANICVSEHFPLFHRDCTSSPIYYTIWEQMHSERRWGLRRNIRAREHTFSEWQDIIQANYFLKTTNLLAEQNFFPKEDVANGRCSFTLYLLALNCAAAKTLKPIASGWPEVFLISAERCGGADPHWSLPSWMVSEFSWCATLHVIHSFTPTNEGSGGWRSCKVSFQSRSLKKQRGRKQMMGVEGEQRRQWKEKGRLKRPGGLAVSLSRSVGFSSYRGWLELEWGWPLARLVCPQV